MNGKQTIGIDAAKRVFHLHGKDVGGRVILREELSRERLLTSWPINNISGSEFAAILAVR